MFFCVSAYVEPTDGFRRIAQNFRTACEASGITPKQAAGYMKLTYSQLMDQLSCRDGKHLSIYRVTLMPRQFQKEFARLMVEQLGAFYLDADLLGATLDAVTRMMGKRPVVYMDLREDAEKEKVG